MSQDHKPGFYVSARKGFHICFDNGWTVSVQFGPGNYSDNYNMRFGSDYEEQCIQAGEKGSSTAEIAAWDLNGKWYTLDAENNTEVFGYQTPAEVLEFMNKIAGLPAVVKEDKK